MKYLLFILFLGNYSILTSCQPGFRVLYEYICQVDAQPPYSTLINFISNDVVKINYKSDDFQTQTNLAALGKPKEASYSLKESRVVFQWPHFPNFGDQIFQIKGNKLIATGRMLIGVECRKN
jgi:hypothetical protein